MREAALVPMPAIAGSEEAAPGDSGLLARDVVASAVGVAIARRDGICGTKRKKENRQPKGGMGGRYTATTQGF